MQDIFASNADFKRVDGKSNGLVEFSIMMMIITVKSKLR